MKHETLLKMYINLGYEPKGLEDYLEVESISKWVYDNFGIYITTIYHSMNFRNGKYQKFSYSHISDIGTDYVTTNHGKKCFVNPFDAKIDGVVNIYGWIKSVYYKGRNREGIYQRWTEEDLKRINEL